MAKRLGRQMREARRSLMGDLARGVTFELLGHQIRDARRVKGWTMGDLARAVGCRVSRVSDVEHDLPEADPSIRCRMAAAVGLDLPVRRVLVFGSRGFPRPALVERVVRGVLRPGDVLVHGACEGSPDVWAAAAAQALGLPCDPQPASWRREDGSIDKSAGHRRNAEMAATLTPGRDVAIGFWDGSSPGTKGMLELLGRRRVRARLYLEPKGADPRQTRPRRASGSQ